MAEEVETEPEPPEELIVIWLVVVAKVMFVPAIKVKAGPTSLLIEVMPPPPPVPH
jgi:hypothetical protein